LSASPERRKKNANTSGVFLAMKWPSGIQCGRDANSRRSPHQCQPNQRQSWRWPSIG
jgi:hypothetical protein